MMPLSAYRLQACCSDSFVNQQTISLLEALFRSSVESTDEGYEDLRPFVSFLNLLLAREVVQLIPHDVLTSTQ
jgi:hypothetical protein